MRRALLFVMLLGAGCDAAACPDGQADCGAGCVDVTSDFLNCGACGVGCLGDQLCTDGRCGCPAGTENCAGDCVVLTESAEHCGACFAACPSGGECRGGACECAGGETVCDGECVPLDDVANCGACGNACGADQSCRAGACECSDSALTACPEGCVDLSRHASNCGACGSVCSSPRACAAGQCVCAVGLTFCGALCVDTSANTSHCGACGNRCSGASSCLSGRCVPQLLWADARESGGRMTVGPFDWDGRVAVASDGSVYLGYSTPDGNVTLAAYSSTGVERWTRTIFTSAERVGDVSIIEGDGVALTAAYSSFWDNPAGAFAGSAGSSDVAVVAFESSGAVRWEYFVQSSGVERTGGLGAGRGQVVVAGSLGGTFDFGGGPLVGDVFRDGFVVLLDAMTGAYVNARLAAGPGSVRPVFAEIAPDGDVIVGGYAGAGVNLGGGPTSTVVGGFLGRLGPDLSHRWSRRVSAEEIHGVAVDSGSNVYISGSVTRTTDWGDGASLNVPSRDDATFLLAVDGATGASRWAGGVTSSFVSLGRGPVIDGAGRVWYAASATGGLGSNDAVLVASRASDGGIVYLEPFGSEGGDLASGIATSGSWLALGGRFGGTARFGTSTFTSSDFDVFVALFSL